MTHGLAFALLWGVSLLGGARIQEVSSVDPPGAGHGVEVPFVAQGPLLCGGASAAMVERFWGRRGVYAEDYAGLVREDEGGIRSSELAAALRRRGYRVEVVSGNPERVMAALDRGIPPIVLLAGGRPALHYVVLLGRRGDDFVVHDPNFGPSRRFDADRFFERWAGSDHWSVIVVPGPATPSRSDTARPRVETRSDPEIDAALEELRSGAYTAARRRTSRLMRADASAALATRVFATAAYLEGDASAALEAWNRLGEPSIDLVAINGTRRIRYHTAADRIGIRPGELLRPRDIRLARRRLLALPAVEAATVGYRPLLDGRVEVRAEVAEARRWPAWTDLGFQAGRAAANGVSSLDLGPFLSSGGRVTLDVGWASAERYLAGKWATAAPPLPGIVEVGVGVRRERYGPSGGTSDDPLEQLEQEERARASLGVTEWVSETVSLGFGASLERWASGRRLGGLSATALWLSPSESIRLDATAEGWFAPRYEYGRVGVGARIRWDRGDHRAWHVAGRLQAAPSDAPRLLWAGAGTGAGRGPLLRAHPLIEEGAIRGPAFSPRLLSATVEHRFYQGVGPLRVGALLFVDAAKAWYGSSATEGGAWVDGGAGLFAEVGGRNATISVARGGGDWVLSATVRPSG